MARTATERFQRFCVVGLGNHARTKLIPAIFANKQEIVGLVTRGEGYQNIPLFRHIDEALAILPDDTVFVIATPPALHFEQAMNVIKAGRDVIIEKPAFITAEESRDAVAQAAQRNCILIEAFMHRHSELYRRLMLIWRAQQQSIERVGVSFLIPEMPAGTFRQDAGIASSSLYDVGAYAVSLLSDLGLPLHGLQIDGVDFAGDPAKETVHLAGALGKVHGDIRVGVNTTYANRVSLQVGSAEVMEFSPFFYGRPSDKIISRSLKSNRTSEIVRDGNAFQEMFAVPRHLWQESQSERTTKMLEVVTTLQRLGTSLIEIRQR
jgi:predicted dehydrogenase